MRDTEEREKQNRLLADIKENRPVCWLNSNKKKADVALTELAFQDEDLNRAEQSWLKFAPLLIQLFPELQKTEGLIESELLAVPAMAGVLQNTYHSFQGNLMLKGDYKLPIAGSVKARGGIYAVLKHAERLALQHRLITESEDYKVLAGEEARNLFSSHMLEVGSTGNLGLSIGIMGSALGFKVIVHMSGEAREWKKDLLRTIGVRVIEYETDYTRAVAAGRAAARKNSLSYFIDDENSEDLFLGYSAAALRLKKQLEVKGIIIDRQNPLFVYLPCGVGGAPGGISFGLKHLYGDNVYCFFVEPTQSPAMLLGLMTGKLDKIKVQDYGLDNQTAADGLAVGSPSPLVSTLVRHLIDGILTVRDQDLFRLLALFKDSENIMVEPSAAAGFMGPLSVSKHLRSLLAGKVVNLTHLVWTTGGSLVPKDIMMAYYQQGRKMK